MKKIIKYYLVTVILLVPTLMLVLGLSFITANMAKADAVISIQPGISILGQTGSSMGAGSTTIFVGQGSKFSVTGMPMGLHGLKYGKDYTIAMSIDPLFTGCYTTAISSDVSWSLICKALTVGRGNILFRIYMNNQVYISNIVTVIVQQLGAVMGSAAPINIAINAGNSAGGSASSTGASVASATPIVFTPVPQQLVPAVQKVGFFQSLFSSIHNFFAHLF